MLSEGPRGRVSCVVAVVWAFDVEKWLVYSARGEVGVGLLDRSLSLAGLG